MIPKHLTRALALLAALAPLPLAAGERLSGEEVRALVAGNSTRGTIVLESPLLGHEFRRFFAADGALVSRNVTKGDTDRGVWRVTEDGALCMKHERWSKGREYCTAVGRDAQGLVRYFKDRPSERFAVENGDAFGLAR